MATLNYFINGQKLDITPEQNMGIIFIEIPKQKVGSKVKMKIKPKSSYPNTKKKVKIKIP